MPFSFFGYTFTLYPLSADQTNLPSPSNHSKPLHRFGNGPFCGFKAPTAIVGKKGVYIFMVDGEVKYVGRCLDDFEKRISREYGHIYPSDCCLVHGQQTNCHINHELNDAFVSGKRVEIGILPIKDDAIIRQTETDIINQMRQTLPFWNISY